MNRTLPKLAISIVMLANINPVFAQADQSSSLQVLHKDESPFNCQVVGNDRNPKSCKAFQLSQIGEILVFTYYFDTTSISFIARAKPVQQTKFAASYITAKMRIAGSNLNDVGYCIVGHSVFNRYQEVVCNSETDLEFSYNRSE